MLKAKMTMDELENYLAGTATRIVAMRINDWYVLGQKAVLVAHTTLCQPEREFPFARYVCIESGKGNSVWMFDGEIL